MAKQRTLRRSIIAGIAIILALSAIFWKTIVTGYYTWQLKRASGEEAWSIATTLERLDSPQIDDWYIAQLSAENWADRERALERVGTRRIVRGVAASVLVQGPPKQDYSASRVLSNSFQGQSFVGGLNAKQTQEYLDAFRWRSGREEDPLIWTTLNKIADALRPGGREIEDELRRLSDDESSTANVRAHARLVLQAHLHPPAPEPALLDILLEMNQVAPTVKTRTSSP